MDSMVGDIVERDSSAKPPQEPKPKPMTQGAPKKRWGERRRPVVLDPSAQQPAAAPRPRPGPARAQSTASTASTASSAASSPRAGQDAPLSDAERVHLENIRRMQQMTPEQIEQEREEIFRSMNPDVLQSLLRRAELKEQEQASAFDGVPGAQPDAPASERQAGPPPPAQAPAAPPGPAVFESQRLAKGATLDESEVDELLGLNEPSSASAPRTAREPERGREAPMAPAAAAAAVPAQREDGADAADADAAGAEAASADAAGAGAAGAAAASTVHFPPPPEELRKYFPDLPVETEKLAWMQPIADEEEQEYSDQLVSVAPSELRFDFNGNLVTPRVSRLIDPSRGLHHHGDAPSAAGYTLPELAHLSRSAHPAQRAMAIQTVGRVLHKFRLRKFAKSSELQEGLDRLIKATRVMETLEEAADERTRSLTVRTYATEALWLANTGAARAP